ncbi:MAG TPA: ATP-binding protein [Candidatus Binataceae bacterium]|nr:ATP-binding protein [Candidatus Binataceae bacterium]
MKASPLSSRIRNGTLLMLSIALVLGIIALPRVYRLGGAIRTTLYRNYISIEAAQHMNAALSATQLAQRDGTLKDVLAANRNEFMHWIDVELGDITEVGEAELAHDIERRGAALFDALGGDAKAQRDSEFTELRGRLDELVRINKQAMFRADSRATLMGQRLSYEYAGGLALLFLIGIALSWTLAWTISKPLAELTDRLRSFSLRGPSLRLGEQHVAELQAVAQEFNRMAERLEEFDKLNVDRLIYEKSKTEAIIESLEDGIVMIDTRGIVAHINELATIILGVEREAALGSPFDDLDSSHPHYLRIRAAVDDMRARPDARQVEVDLHVRGRDHTYVLKAVPLRQDQGPSFGTILILQDITYLRDKDRARVNLVATLSHELKTPLTSLALAAELLDRSRTSLDQKQCEWVDTIREEAARMRQLADSLLGVAHGEGGAIAIRRVALNFSDLVSSVVKTFAIQVEQKQVKLKTMIAAPDLAVVGDPVKLSWVVSNLVGNALRYTPAGGTITVYAQPQDGGVQLKVRDSGPGIAAQIRDHLFERFAQWSPNGFEAGAGGLGLAIAKDIVEGHGGRIFVESSAEGSEFTVELPAGTYDVQAAHS